VAGAKTYVKEPGGGTDETEHSGTYSLFITPGGTVSQAANVDSFDSDGFTLDYSTSSAGTTDVVVWAVGDSAAASSAPTLSNATATSIGQTTATVGCTVTF